MPVEKPQDPTAVALRSSEVTTLVHNAVRKSKCESCSSTQISAEPEPQRVWKEEKEEVVVVGSL